MIGIFDKYRFYDFFNSKMAKEKRIRIIFFFKKMFCNLERSIRFRCPNSMVGVRSCNATLPRWKGLNLDVQHRASSNVNLFCLNRVEKALPISQFPGNGTRPNKCFPSRTTGNPVTFRFVKDDSNHCRCQSQYPCFLNLWMNRVLPARSRSRIGRCLQNGAGKTNEVNINYIMVHLPLFLCSTSWNIFQIPMRP